MAAKGEMEPKKLPPTDSAAIYHSYRVTVTEFIPSYWEWTMECLLF